MGFLQTTFGQLAQGREASVDLHPESLGSEFVEDLQAFYRRLRPLGPVHQVIVWGGVRAWLITGYEEAKALLADHRLAKDHFKALKLFPPGLGGPHRSPLSANMLHADPPDHTRLRKLVNKAFAARAVQHLRPRVEQITEELIDDLDTRVGVDLIRSFALPLPIRVISALLGIPEADRAAFVSWIEPFIGSTSAARQRSAEEALGGYLPRLLADKRVQPDDDLLSELVAVSEDDDRLSEAELLSMTFLLIMAGYETTVNLIGNSVFALLRDRDKLARLRADPTLLPAAVEEFLRLESPLNTATTRFTVEPVRVGDVEIPANEFVLVALLAANHDEARFDHPAELDFTRSANQHLAFGHGIHYCVGAPLARLEGEVALGRLVDSFPNMTLDTTKPAPQYRKSTLMHGLRSLPVILNG
ncbi:cytochrome P450 family protein [Kibdelosporangium aridum]|nr:cytochrome P450 [Kibdelosporangium aridum]